MKRRDFLFGALGFAALAPSLTKKQIFVEKLQKKLIDGAGAYYEADKEGRAEFIQMWRNLEQKHIQKGKPGYAKLCDEYIKLLVENFG